MYLFAGGTGSLDRETHYYTMIKLVNKLME
jgi:hypothetical protein